MWTWIKGLPWYVQVGLLLIALFIVYHIYLFIKRKLESGNYNASVTQSQTALNQLQKQGVMPSYGQAEYTSMANALEQAFSGCGSAYATVVEPTFKRMKNDADIYALIKAYGVRAIDECAWGTFNGDLAATLAYKLTGFTFCPPNDLFCTGSVSGVNKALKDNGLSFQF